MLTDDNEKGAPVTEEQSYWNDLWHIKIVGKLQYKVEKQPRQKKTGSTTTLAGCQIAKYKEHVGLLSIWDTPPCSLMSTHNLP